MKNEGKYKLVYDFFLKMETTQKDFKLKDLVNVTKWANSTITTYATKNWHTFLFKQPNNCYKCIGLKEISLQQFIKLNTQTKGNKHANQVNKLLKKARHFCLLAVFIYNNPFSEFRVYGYIANVIIAWTALLQAFFEKHKVDYFFKDNNGHYKYIDDQKQAWSLSYCIKEIQKKNTALSNPIIKNLEILIKLRNTIEHYDLPLLSSITDGYCQASLINFENFIVENFGEEHVLYENLAISLQLSKTSQAEKMEAIKNIHSENYSVIKKVIEDFEKGIPENIFGNQQYKVKLWQIPKIDNSDKNMNIPMIEFINYDPTNPNEVEQIKKCISFFKERHVTVEHFSHELRPGEVSRVLSERIGRNFNNHHHTVAWKKYVARPRFCEQNLK